MDMLADNMMHYCVLYSMLLEYILGPITRCACDLYKRYRFCVIFGNSKGEWRQSVQLVHLQSGGHLSLASCTNTCPRPSASAANQIGEGRRGNR